jgi:hypothetical protein
MATLMKMGVSRLLNRAGAAAFAFNAWSGRHANVNNMVQKIIIDVVRQYWRAEGKAGAITG